MIPPTCIGLSLPSKTYRRSHPQTLSTATRGTTTSLSSTISPYQQPEKQHQQQEEERSEDEDRVFLEFCDMMGIEMPYASVRTTDESVAGRGVFCDLNRSSTNISGNKYDKDRTKDNFSRTSSSNSDSKNRWIVPKGTTMIRIPAPAVLCTPTASQFFPQTFQYIDECLRRISLQHRKGMSTQQHQSRTRRVVSKLGRFLSWPIRCVRNLRNSKSTTDNNTDDTIDLDPEVMEFADESDFWQIELTLYALECLQNHPDHPWTTWISQWRRDDPVQRLYERKGGVTFRDKDSIEECVDELHSLLPDANKLKLFAAVDIRLRRLEALKSLFRIDDDTVSGFDSMYGIVTSRAIGLGDDDETSSDESFSAVIPGFDMINHSPTSNLCLSFDEETNYFELIARRDIAHNEELFLTYTRPGTGTIDGTNDSWNEESAIWTLVQWGIPERKKKRQ